MTTTIARPTIDTTTFNTGAANVTATAVRRARLGNSTEDISYSPRGTFGGQFIILDGYDVLLLTPGKDGTPQKLFDVRNLAVTGAPRGFAFLESEQLFVFNDLRRRSTLLLADLKGRPAGERTILFPDGFAPDQLEGIDAMPSSLVSPRFGGEQLLVAANKFTPAPSSRLEVLTRFDTTYRTTRDVMPPAPVGTSFVAGAAFRQGLTALRSGGFVVGSDDFVALLDSAGALLRDAQINEAISIEGVAETETGVIYAADVAAGKLFALGPKLNRMPELDRDYRVGFGLFSPLGLAWDAVRQRHLVLSTSAATGTPPRSGVPVTLDAAEQFIDLAALNFPRGRRMAYGADEGLLA